MNYYNGAGRCYLMPEQPLEPPDCWQRYETEYDDECLSAVPLDEVRHSLFSEEEVNESVEED